MMIASNVVGLILFFLFAFSGDLADAQGGVTTFRPIFQQKQDIDFTGIVELNETNFREVAHDKSVHTFVLFTSFKWYCVECHRANYFWPLLADKYKDDATLKFAFWDLDHHDPKPLNIKGLGWPSMFFFKMDNNKMIPFLTWKNEDNLSRFIEAAKTDSVKSLTGTWTKIGRW